MPARLCHDVYFTLTDGSPAKVQELVDACHTYLTVQAGIAFFAAGQRCDDLTRDVNDQDWHVGLHVVFVDKAAHDAYQDDPTHNQFIAEMRYNWGKVRVFDSYV